MESVPPLKVAATKIDTTGSAHRRSTRTWGRRALASNEPICCAGIASESRPLQITAKANRLLNILNPDRTPRHPAARSQWFVTNLGLDLPGDTVTVGLVFKCRVAPGLMAELIDRIEIQTETPEGEVFFATTIDAELIRGAPTVPLLYRVTLYHATDGRAYVVRTRVHGTSRRLDVRRRAARRQELPGLAGEEAD
jgi:hypothetical protein